MVYTFLIFMMVGMALECHSDTPSIALGGAALLMSAFIVRDNLNNGVTSPVSTPQGFALITYVMSMTVTVSVWATLRFIRTKYFDD